MLLRLLGPREAIVRAQDVISAAARVIVHTAADNVVPIDDAANNNALSSPRV